MIDAVGARFGYALVYVKENGRELVFLAAINETEKGICTLELKRNRDARASEIMCTSSPIAAQRIFVQAEQHQRTFFAHERILMISHVTLEYPAGVLHDHLSVARDIPTCASHAGICACLMVVSITNSGQSSWRTIDTF
jgi:hypothetical protein